MIRDFYIYVPGMIFLKTPVTKTCAIMCISIRMPLRLHVLHTLAVHIKHQLFEMIERGRGERVSTFNKILHGTWSEHGCCNGQEVLCNSYTPVNTGMTDCQCTCLNYALFARSESLVHILQPLILPSKSTLLISQNL